MSSWWTPEEEKRIEENIKKEVRFKEEVIEVALRYLDELARNGDGVAKFEDIRNKIIDTIRYGSLLRKEGRVLKEKVRSYEITYINKETGEKEECEEFEAPYVRVGKVEIVQLDTIDEFEGEGNVDEIEWGVREIFRVKCVVGEWEYEGKNMIEKRRGCSVNIKIIPKTPIVYIEYEEDNSCWLNNTIRYVYVHPYGWFVK